MICRGRGRLTLLVNCAMSSSRTSLTSCSGRPSMMSASSPASHVSSAPLWLATRSKPCRKSYQFPPLCISVVQCKFSYDQVIWSSRSDTNDCSLGRRITVSTMQMTFYLLTPAATQAASRKTAWMNHANISI